MAFLFVFQKEVDSDTIQCVVSPYFPTAVQAPPPKTGICCCGWRTPTELWVRRFRGILAQASCRTGVLDFRAKRINQARWAGSSGPAKRRTVRRGFCYRSGPRPTPRRGSGRGIRIFFSGRQLESFGLGQGPRLTNQCAPRFVSSFLADGLGPWVKTRKLGVYIWRVRILAKRQRFHVDEDQPAVTPPYLA